MGRVWAKRIILLAMAAASLGWGQSAPSISTIVPASVPAGSNAITLTVNGANFAASPNQSGQSTVFLNIAPVSTTFVNSTTLTAAVPASLLISPSQYGVHVLHPSGAVSNTVTFSVLAPGISSLSTTSIPAGSPAFGLTVTGVNFLAGSQVSFRGTTLSTSFVNSTTLTTTVPANLIAASGQASVQVINPGGASSATLPFVVGPPAVAISSSSGLPQGVVGVAYAGSIVATGGTVPYVFSLGGGGLPDGLTLSFGGAISGTPKTPGQFPFFVLVTDSTGASASGDFSITIQPAPLNITGGPTAPVSAGTAISISFGGTGGVGPYRFTPGGSLPPGTTFSNGVLSGTPTTAGTFTFSVTIADSTGAVFTKNFTLTVTALPLSLSGSLSDGKVGVPYAGQLSASGGTGPYSFAGSGLPGGLSLSASGSISGTPTTVGTFTFRVTIADSTGAVLTKDFTLTVTAPSLSLSGSLGNGKVGVPYAGQLSASGGTGPYSYAGTGLPDGLSLAASGSISGTPTTAGQFSVTATVTDSKGATASGTFPITIVPADLTIVTAALPDGVVGVAYSAGLIASGGLPPYTCTVTGLPDGVTATSAGVISGTPKTAAKFTVNASVKDSAGASAAKSYSVTIAAVPLAITTASAPNGIVGTAYSAGVAASGGTPPYTFSASGLPPGLSMSAGGTISGAPTAPGPATIVVTVKDAAGASASKSFAVTIGLPSTPPLNLTFAGVSGTVPPLQQPRLQISLGSTFPVDVVVTLTLGFAPDSGADDPAIQFSGGGRTARITVPAGATNGATDVAVQTGSVAGLITTTAQMQASAQDVTPSPAPRSTIRIAAAAPVIVPGTLTAVRNTSGFTVTLTGYVTDREMTQAVFAFTAASGSNLQTTTLTVPADTLFAPYFSGSGSAAFGSQFTYTQPFTVTGSTQAIVSVTVTLVNKIGQSTPVTATLN